MAHDGGAGLRSNVIALFLAATSGALTAWLGFAPIGWWWVPYLSFAVLATLLQVSLIHI